VPIPGFRLGGVVLGTPDPARLASFYESLLGLVRHDDEPEWVRSGPADGTRPSLGFQLEHGFVAPVWPPQEGRQQMTQHLDIAVSSLAEAVAHAESLGARLATRQPQDDVRVMFDPDGHVFCLFEGPIELFED
jgi:catechol 2,3-dioxygenase-like lactoylglutathione lyase family enzyme